MSLSKRRCQLTRTDAADVIVVGAGPAGATAATYLARSGVDVLLLEKSTFPRDKVCGDGLTPRGVKQVLALGVDVSGSDWIKNKGLRVVGGGTSLELPWPVLQDFPDFGLVRPRRDFDEMLATLAVKAGARMRVATTVTAPVRDDRTGRITGVTAKTADGPKEFRAPLILACDGVSARVALGMGINKRDDRPLGVAVRRYYNSPSRTNDDYLESHLELWDRIESGQGRSCCPATAGSSGSATARSTSGSACSARPRRSARPTTAPCCGPGWTAPRRSGGCARRTPSARSAAPACRWASTAPRTTRTACCWSATPAARSTRSTARASPTRWSRRRSPPNPCCRPSAGPEGASREAALHGYVTAMKDHLGAYYRLGGIFSTLIGKPAVMKTATRLGLPRKDLMYLVLKLLAGLYDSRDGDWADKVVRSLTRMAPSV